MKHINQNFSISDADEVIKMNMIILRDLILNTNWNINFGGEKYIDSKTRDKYTLPQTAYIIDIIQNIVYKSELSCFLTVERIIQ